MKTILMLAATGVLLAGSASAAPLINQASSVEQPALTENVRLVCRADGSCYRTGRRYVERRYYGDSYAYGPRDRYIERRYDYGPGYYDSGPSIGFSFGTGRW